MSAPFIISVVPVHDAVIQVESVDVVAGDLVARGDHYEAVVEVVPARFAKGNIIVFASGPRDNPGWWHVKPDEKLFIFDLQRAARYVYGLDPDDGYGDEVAFAHENAVPR